MEEKLKELFNGDWGRTTVCVLSGVLALTFISAPRAISELIAYSRDAFGFGAYSGSPNIRWLVGIGVPVGMLAGSWRNAALGLIAASVAVFLAEPDLPTDEEDQGLAYIGIVMFIAYTAASVRWTIGQRELEKPVRYGLAIAGIFCAAVGLTRWAPLFSQNAPYGINLDNSVTEDVISENGIEDTMVPDGIFGPGKTNIDGATANLSALLGNAFSGRKENPAPTPDNHAETLAPEEPNVDASPNSGELDTEWIDRITGAQRGRTATPTPESSD